MRHKSNYDWMLFLTSPMAFVWARTHDFVFNILKLIIIIILVIKTYKWNISFNW